MTTAELSRRLLEEGCNPANFSVGQRSYDGICLLGPADGRAWRVLFSERGQDSPPMFESDSEADACAFYFDFMVNHVRQDHCVGFFHREAAALALRAQLEAHGLAVHSSAIRYRSPHDWRYMVFVVGKAVFEARRLLGEIPLEDAPLTWWERVKSRGL
jgi:hypothetical protein